ncbi:hypothetical protein B0H15DRAFT_505029 [Mycena belliarum]|uniref:Uncharacterized protein n=1 Tax=Mycena belliarum TaxID=1033014 RepID=A0AAD6UEK1_9AGAR|nr:hypothetical protein B0H15DRAFT_505029 [Mycena belliae]
MADAKGKGKARADPPEDIPQNPCLIRITNHGKIKPWVAFALDFLEKHDDIPVVLHTLPAPPKPGPAPTPETERAAGGPIRTAKNANAKPAAAISPSTSTVPRLISVVEIIKREYLKKLELEHSSTLVGLHQYNEVGTLEALGLAPVDTDAEMPQDAEARRAREIMAALEGKNYVKIKQTAFMKVTLSRVELTGLSAVTHQPPAVRKLSKSAKARAKRREKKAEAADGVEAE